MERTVWDGDQVLVEIRAPGGDEVAESMWESDNPGGDYFGRASYTHAAGIDAPLAVTRTGLAQGTVTVFPHANWRGEFADGSVPGRQVPHSQCVGASDCPPISWPGKALTLDGAPPAGTPPAPSWWGSLLGRKTDGSGLQYMRNRYYDPKTGKFTQVDPIGLAGGLNLYGFAGGDPVTYSDPFGLCPVCYVVFEAGATLYDLGDLAVTGAKYLRGRASGQELSVTAAGVGAGIVGFGGGYGRAGRLALRATESWGNAGTLARHFREHGSDFGAKNADEYASMASDFFQSAQQGRLPTKIDSEGIIRVYDPKTNTFGSYNPDGTTRTFFKPSSKTYWERQPGSSPQTP